ncbi:hypothetical protein V5O48_003725 [Marasmius crinis-equi]|uniref:Uncharacterized protein n=1 Tax=Marasmius crinis-equi TaxID=585013 RepID=A0ABR3FS35_9AGAR
MLKFGPSYASVAARGHQQTVTEPFLKSAIETCATSTSDSNPSGEWEIHPLCGIIHTARMDCGVCESHLDHIRDSKSDPEQTAFHQALYMMHNNNDKSYEEGYELGWKNAMEAAFRRDDVDQISLKGNTASIPNRAETGNDINHSKRTSIY